MTKYTCPTCGIADDCAWMRCNHPDCPDGRDQAKYRPLVGEPARRVPWWFGIANPLGGLIVLAAFFALLRAI